MHAPVINKCQPGAPAAKVLQTAPVHTCGSLNALDLNSSQTSHSSGSSTLFHAAGPPVPPSPLALGTVPPAHTTDTTYTTHTTHAHAHTAYTVRSLNIGWHSKVSTVICKSR